MLIFAFALSTAPVAWAAEAPHDTLTLPPAEESVTIGAAPAETISSAAPPPVTINVAPVSAPSIDGLGVLDDKNGGLPAAIWAGTTRETAEQLLSWLHGGVSNQALRDITVKLLMTQATPPSGAGQDWFSLRVRALITMGQDEKAEQMIASVPASMITDSLEQVRAELLFLRGDNASACKPLEAALAKAGGALFWQRLNVLCKLADGKKDEAMLALDLLKEANAKEDAFLQDIARKMTDKSYSIKALPAQWSMFEVAAVRLAGETDKLRDRLDVLPPLSLKYIAADATLDPKLRDKAAGKAIMLGIIPAKDIAKTPPMPFVRTLAGDVTTLVQLLAKNTPANETDNAVIARLAVDDATSLQDARRVQRLLTLMEPFGYKVPTALWDKLFQRKGRYDGEAPPAALIDRLNEATHAGRKAEVLLLSALIMGSTEAEKTHELVLLPLIKSLRGAGFATEAQALAYDAVKSYSAH